MSAAAEQSEGILARLARGNRVPSAPPLLFGGRSHPKLTAAVAEHLGTDIGQVTHETFANGELYCRFDESVRGADVFLLQSCSGAGQVNDHLVELLLMINAAKLASAKRITAVIPWYPYSRQDKKSAAREPISARLVADLLEKSGIDRVLTMDLHAGQIQGFFSVPCDHTTALLLFVDHLRSLGLEGDNVVAVSPDAGRTKTTRRFASRLGCDMAMLNKHRPGHDRATISHLLGEVEGKVAVMTDDIIATGGTLAAGAEVLREKGATAVYACATHALFPEGSLERLENAFEKIIVTDTVPLADELIDHPKVEVISVAPLLGDTIARVWAGESVSEAFLGENNIF